VGFGVGGVGLVATGFVGVGFVTRIGRFSADLVVVGSVDLAVVVAVTAAVETGLVGIGFAAIGFVGIGRRFVGFVAGRFAGIVGLGIVGTGIVAGNLVGIVVVGFAVGSVAGSGCCLVAAVDFVVTGFVGSVAAVAGLGTVGLVVVAAVADCCRGIGFVAGFACPAGFVVGRFCPVVAAGLVVAGFGPRAVFLGIFLGGFGGCSSRRFWIWGLGRGPWRRRRGRRGWVFQRWIVLRLGGLRCR